MSRRHPNTRIEQTNTWQSGRRIQRLSAVACVLLASQMAHPVTSFSASSLAVTRVSPSALHAVAAGDEDMTKQLARAKELIEKSKAKIEARQVAMEEEEEEESSNGAVPFFASKADTTSRPRSKNKMDQVIKSTNEDGLFTTDGEKMAQLSEKEEWQVRPLLEVFENEAEDDSDDDYFANRDVAASIYGLRKVLQTEDFMKIFNKRDRWIGDP